MEKEEEKKEKPNDIHLHENGVWYKEISMQGLDENIKLFNSDSSSRLKGETKMEYKIRRKLLGVQKKEIQHIYNPSEHIDNRGKRIPYVNTNKKREKR